MAGNIVSGPPPGLLSLIPLSEIHQLSTGVWSRDDRSRAFLSWRLGAQSKDHKGRT
jgi:hypothetical protein